MGDIDNYIYLTPCIPLSFEGEGADKIKRGANAPLKHPCAIIKK